MLRRALDQALGQMQVGAVTMGGLVFMVQTVNEPPLLNIARLSAATTVATSIAGLSGSSW